jgi:acylphosphatase
VNETRPLQIRHLLVSGRVQGVGFRWFTRERARRRGLRGWVQNRPDGTVEVHVCGSEDILAGFLTELALGPDGAHVSEIADIAAVEGTESVDALPYPFHIQRQPRL